MAQLSLDENYIHPSAVIGPDVELGDSNRIGAHVVLMGRIRIGARNYLAPGLIIDASAFAALHGQELVVNIGDDNYLGNGVSLGAPSRQRFPGQHRTETPSDRPALVVGNSVVMHDFVTVHAPVVGQTVVEDAAVIGAHSHISHDCLVMKRSILAAGTLMGGYCATGSGSTLGLGARIHPRVAIGPTAMIGAGAVVLEHVPPAASVAGVPARLLGINERGLIRNYGASAPLVEAFRNALRAFSGTGGPPEVLAEWSEFNHLVSGARGQRDLLRHWADGA